jgi:hypothetical protein
MPEEGGLLAGQNIDYFLEREPLAVPFINFLLSMICLSLLILCFAAWGIMKDGTVFFSILLFILVWSCGSGPCSCAHFALESSTE